MNDDYSQALCEERHKNMQKDIDGFFKLYRESHMEIKNQIEKLNDAMIEISKCVSKKTTKMMSIFIVTLISVIASLSLYIVTGR